MLFYSILNPSEKWKKLLKQGMSLKISTLWSNNLAKIFGQNFQLSSRIVCVWPNFQQDILWTNISPFSMYLWTHFKQTIFKKYFLITPLSPPHFAPQRNSLWSFLIEVFVSSLIMKLKSIKSVVHTPTNVKFAANYSLFR